MTSYAMVVNVNLCYGCMACNIACHDEYVGNDWLPYSASQAPAIHSFYPEFNYVPGQSWMTLDNVERGAYPYAKRSWVHELCHQCSNPPCVAAANNPGTDTYILDNGIVIINPTTTQGQSQIAAACPYGRIYMNSISNTPQKCTFCAHLLAAGKSQPKCVDACPTTAFTFGDLDDKTSAVYSMVNSGEAVPLHPEYGTQPRVYYIGLPTMFIAGQVVHSKAQSDTNGVTNEVIAGATVTLTFNSVVQGSQTTDWLGQFEFDGLGPFYGAGGLYSISVSASGETTATFTGGITTSTYIGTLALSP